MNHLRIFRCGIAGMVMFCFLSQVSLNAWPAVGQKKPLPNNKSVIVPDEESPASFEKKAPTPTRGINKKRFPLLVVIGGAFVAGALLYFLVIKKSKTDEDKPLIIEPAGTVTDYDGNVYQAVRIGDQIWMAENLRSTHYRDGTPLSYTVYDNDEANVMIYGRLYTSAAAINGAPSSNANPSGVQGAAPLGWHIPSPAEWRQLAGVLGGEQIAGGKLKEAGTTHWLSPNTGATNESLFTALPAGMFLFATQFQWLGTRSVFATSQQDASSQTIVTLWHDKTELTITGYHPGDAVSVRCVKDE